MEPHNPVPPANDPQRDWKPTPQPPAHAYPSAPGGQADANWQRPVESPLHHQQQHPHDPYAPTQYGPTPAPVTSPPATPRTHAAHRDARRYSNKAKDLNLSPGEVLLSDVRRHPIGVLQIYLVAGFVLLSLLFGAGALVRYLNSSPQEGVIGGSAFPFPVELITWMAFGLGLLTVVISIIAIHVYNGNRLYVTNESVIQFVQLSLFSRKQQTIGLGNIEDVSYEQHGIIEHIFHYGTIRLSTEGEETTYFFRYAAHPKEQADKIIDAQEQFNLTHQDDHR